MKIRYSLVVFGLVLAILIAGVGNEVVRAGNASGWSPDERVPGYLEDTFTPFLLADKNRTVHAFASQWVENDGRRRAIIYRQWSLDGGWTRPVDIILAPSGDADFLGAYLDPSDTIHMIFKAGESRNLAVYYSNAPAAIADWAPAWSKPVMVGNGATDLNSAAILGDDQGNVVVIYSGNLEGSGVYYIHSKNSGKDWSDPLPMFLTFDTNLSTFSLHLTIGAEQRIRAVWNVVTNIGGDETVYFANFDSQDSTWVTPVELDKRINLPDFFGPSFPVVVDNGREIVVVYNSGNPFTGRPVGAGRPIQRARISTNGGVTWNEPLDPFPFHVGRSGEHAMVLDGMGTPHTLFIQRIESLDEEGHYSIIGGLWHSSFQSGGWSNPDRFVTTVNPHDVHAVVSQGNVLLAVWREDPGVGQSGIWYSYKILDEPELPIVPLATALLDYSVQVIPTSPAALIIPEPTIRPELLDEGKPSDLGSNPDLPIIIGIVPVALILIGAILGYGFMTNRRR